MSTSNEAETGMSTPLFSKGMNNTLSMISEERINIQLYMFDTKLEKKSKDFYNERYVYWEDAKLSLAIIVGRDFFFFFKGTLIC